MFGFGMILGVLVFLGLIGGGAYLYFKYVKKSAPPVA